MSRPAFSTTSVSYLTPPWSYLQGLPSQDLSSAEGHKSSTLMDRSPPHSGPFTASPIALPALLLGHGQPPCWGEAPPGWLPHCCHCFVLGPRVATCHLGLDSTRGPLASRWPELALMTWP